jgi:hypothetical protein
LTRAEEGKKEPATVIKAGSWAQGMIKSWLRAV